MLETKLADPSTLAGRTNGALYNLGNQLCASVLTGMKVVNHHHHDRTRRPHGDPIENFKGTGNVDGPKLGVLRIGRVAIPDLH